MKGLIPLVGLILSLGIIAQTSSENWKVLIGLEYEKFHDEYGKIYVPRFGPEIKALERKEIELAGYTSFLMKGCLSLIT